VQLAEIQRDYSPSNIILFVILDWCLAEKMGLFSRREAAHDPSPVKANWQVVSCGQRMEHIPFVPVAQQGELGAKNYPVPTKKLEIRIKAQSSRSGVSVSL
jgi:hypothetical protein